VLHDGRGCRMRRKVAGGEGEHTPQGDVKAVDAGRAAAGSGRPMVMRHCRLSHDSSANMQGRMSVEQGNVWHEVE
jgi:hypothetical protein